MAGRSAWSGHEVHGSTGLGVVVVYKTEFDGHELNEGFSNDQNQNENLFASGNLQLIEHIFEDEGNLGASSVQEEEPGEKG